MLIPCFGAEAQLPSGVSLPAGMSVEDAKKLAQQNGVSVPSTKSSDMTDKGTGGIPTTEKTSVDPREGDALHPLRDSAAIDTAVDSSARISHPDTAVYRWGQKLFRTGSSNLGAGHVGAIGPDYALGPGDEIVVTIWGQKEARYQLELDRDGQVSMEYIGVISLNGQTFRSAETLLRKRMAKVYAGLNDGSTQMDVTMGKLKQIRIYVVGDVVQPGSYMLSGNTSVLAALFLAKGPTDLGTERRIEIRRGTSVVVVDLYDYLAKGRRPDQDALRDGDVVHVGKHRNVVEVKGAVGRPGLYELLPEEGAKELLQYAAGVKLNAAEHPLAAVRFFPGGRREVVLLRKPSEYASGLNSAMSDSDKVVVYEGKDLTQATVVADGEFLYPGPYPWIPGMTLADLIRNAGGTSRQVVPGYALIRRVREDESVYITRSLFDSSVSASQLLLPRDTITLLNRIQFAVGDSVSISGAVRKETKVVFRPGMTLRDLILLADGFRKVQAPPGVLNPGDSMSRAVPDTSGAFTLDTALWFPAGAAVVQRKTFDGLGKVETFGLAPIPEVVLAEGDSVQIIDRLASNHLDSVRVTGMVPNPGNQPGLEGLRVRDIILRAGGFLPEADPTAVRLEYPLDSVGAKTEVLVLDSSLATPEAYRLVPRGGQVAVPRRLDHIRMDLVHLKGEVVRPGSFALQESDERLASIIKRAQGLTDRAFPEGTILLRTDLAGHGRVVVDLPKALLKPGTKYDPVMRDGDSLIIPRRPFSVKVIGRVNRPGLVTWKEGASWKQYVSLAGGYSDSANEDGVFVEQSDGRVQTRGEGIDPPLPGSTVEVPFKKPAEPLTLKDVFVSLNTVLATAIAGLTIFVLLQK